MTYNVNRVTAKIITEADLRRLIGEFQRAHNLQADGMCGPKTIAALREAAPAPGTPHDASWPICLPLDPSVAARAPLVTSGHFLSNPERPNHNGVDIMYPYRTGDPTMHIGDAGRTLSYWCPQGTTAVAFSAGIVVLAGHVTTGWRAWVHHGDDLFSGYFHLTELFVKEGDRVTARQRIGLVGDNPVDDDPRHLHFELHAGPLGEYPMHTIDPEPMLLTAAKS
jgi:hypothetical protein